MTYTEKAEAWLKDRDLTPREDVLAFAMSLDFPLPALHLPDVVTVEQYNAALDPIMDGWVQDCEMLMRRLALYIVPIAKQLEDSSMDQVFKDAIIKRMSEKLNAGIEAMDKVFEEYE